MEVVAVSQAEPQWLDIRGQHVQTSIIHVPLTNRNDSILVESSRGVEKNFPAVHNAEVYAFFAHHYDYWSEKLGVARQAWDWCHWGENMTLHCPQLSEADFHLGDVWRIGKDAILQVCGSRVPCFKLAWRCSQKDSWLQELAATGKCGVYLKVVQGGRISPGDKAVLLSKRSHAPLLDCATITRVAFADAQSTRSTMHLLKDDPDLLDMNKLIFRRKLSMLYDQELVGKNTWKGWRQVRVLTVVEESLDIKSFHLVAASKIAGQENLEDLASYLPGQFIIVRLPNGLIRPWSLSSYPIESNRASPEQYRVSIKRDGKASSWMHDYCAPGALLDIKAPSGLFCLDWSPQFPGRQIYVSAGIGITPMMAMFCAHLQHQAMQRAPAVWIHVARNYESVPFVDELTSLLSRPEAQELTVPVILFLTGSRSEDCAAVEDLLASKCGTKVTIKVYSGRPTVQSLDNLVSNPYFMDPLRITPIQIEGRFSTVYICGTPGFEASIRGIFATLGIPDAMILAESFSAPWEMLAQQKRDAIFNAIPKAWRIEAAVPSAEEQRDVTGSYIQQFLNAREIEITETDAVGILEKTTTGEWSAREVTEAFCHRAAIAHQLVNCLHDLSVDLALEHASQLDNFYQKHKKPIGPLHGLPISIKDQFHVKGLETTMGFTSYGSGVLLPDSGTPTLMSGETNSNIVGYTWNPKNRNLSAGGSSGGEGALLSLRGSPLGFGTDIGGSVRLPAAFNGVYGIRPSSGRIPYYGTSTSMEGQESIPSVIGPLATTIRSLKFVFKALMSREPWKYDPLVIEIPWRDEQAKQLSKVGSGKKLAFGVLRKDDLVFPNPPIRRALDMVVEALEKAGHDVIEWTPPSHSRGAEISLQTWMFDGGEDIHAQFRLSGEPVIPQISKLYGIEPFAQKHASDVAAINVAKRNYQKEYMDYWNSSAAKTQSGQPVDAVIMPLAPYPAARPNEFHYYHYSMIINCLDYSSVAIPVTQVDKNIDIADRDYTPANAKDQHAHDIYDPEVYDGAFVGLQIVGRRLQEEKVLALGELVSSLL
ncbi:Acetamidase [Cladobotryum mycophilum]|uniref:amidase n=1 Tax=Cladobotryum mycophilum TaxID=491253 RepID=A0ABR0SQA8_9HYPO